MINGKILKVCGMRQDDNIRRVEALGIDWMGFIFYPGSPRCMSQTPSCLPVKAKRVGVFVNETIDNISALTDRFALDYIQLHGNESPGFCAGLMQDGLKVIKAFSLSHPEDLHQTVDYTGNCHYFLFDTKCEQYGGSGNRFDWNILEHYQGNTPFLLSGGIDECSAEALKAIGHPQLAGYDINSRFELAPGVKDVERIKRFINQLN